VCLSVVGRRRRGRRTTALLDRVGLRVLVPRTGGGIAFAHAAVAAEAR